MKKSELSFLIPTILSAGAYMFFTFSGDPSQYFFWFITSFMGVIISVTPIIVSGDE